MKTFQEFMSILLDEERVPVRKRGGISAPEGERSIGGQANRDNKDYWASVIGKNRDRGQGSAAKRRADALRKEELEIEEGMTMKDFKKQRSRQKQKDKRAAEKTSPLRRAGIHADKASPERAARHRANVDPDFEGNDERNYPGGKLRPNKVRKAKALGELD
jgi:phage protein D